MYSKKFIFNTDACQYLEVDRFEGCPLENMCQVSGGTERQKQLDYTANQAYISDWQNRCVPRLLDSVALFTTVRARWRKLLPFLIYYYRKSGIVLVQNAYSMRSTTLVMRLSRRKG